MGEEKMKTCDCCKTNDVGKNTFYCESCWSFLLPDRDKAGITWGDIWYMLCHWHSLHDESNKDYEFVHQLVIQAYKYERSEK